MSDQNNLYKCKTSIIPYDDVITVDAEGEYKISTIWKEQTKGKLTVTDEKISFKNMFLKPIDLSYDGVRSALLLSTKIAFIKCYILCIRHSDGDYAFSLLRNKFWDGDLPFEVIREDGKAITSDFIKEFAKGAISGIVGEEAGGAIGDIAKGVLGAAIGETGGIVASVATDKVVDSMEDHITKSNLKEEKGANPKPSLFVIKRGEKKSHPLTQNKLVQMIKDGKVKSTDIVFNVTDKKRINTKQLIEKFRPA